MSFCDVSKLNVMMDARPYTLEKASPLERPLLGGNKLVPDFQRNKKTPEYPFHTDVNCMDDLGRSEILSAGGPVFVTLIV